MLVVCFTCNECMDEIYFGDSLVGGFVRSFIPAIVTNMAEVINEDEMTL